MAKQRTYIRPNVDLAGFLAGETLTYRGFKFNRIEATYRVGDGIYLERKGEDLGKAEITDDRSARRVYVNLTRRPPSAKDFDEEDAS